MRAFLRPSHLNPPPRPREFTPEYGRSSGSIDFYNGSNKNQVINGALDSVRVGQAADVISPVAGVVAMEQKTATVAQSPMIVRTVGITLVTQDFDKSRAGLDEILKRHHGYVGGMTVNTPEGAARQVNATLRVPARELDATLAEIRKLGHVEGESQNGEEITQQYVDLEARLANARTIEQRLKDLLRERTGKLSDVLAVELQVGRVRGEIEQMEAERKSMVNRVDFATLNATIIEDYKERLHVVPESTWTRFRNAAVDGYRTVAEGVVSVLLFVASYGPSILLWGAILFFPARWAWRKWRSRLIV
jgi:hypothetical protein